MSMIQQSFLDSFSVQHYDFYQKTVRSLRTIDQGHSWGLVFGCGDQLHGPNSAG